LTINYEEYAEIRDFLYKEARLADESRYSEWEALVDDDMFYWVPRGEGDFDPAKDVSITADNRTRIKTRIAQLNTGERYSQVPVSPMRRLISNIEIERSSDQEYKVLSNFVLYELRAQSTHNVEVWPGRVEHGLRRNNNELKMFLKKVMLINGNEPLPSIAFLI
jgi:benzoate/toluate 1,2-dioxygenase subunit beta